MSTRKDPTKLFPFRVQWKVAPSLGMPTSAHKGGPLQPSLRTRPCSPHFKLIKVWSFVQPSYPAHRNGFAPLKITVTSPSILSHHFDKVFGWFYDDFGMVCWGKPVSTTMASPGTRPNHTAAYTSSRPAGRTYSRNSRSCPLGLQEQIQGPGPPVHRFLDGCKYCSFGAAEQWSRWDSRCASLTN